MTASALLYSYISGLPTTENLPTTKNQSPHPERSCRWRKSGQVYSNRKMCMCQRRLSVHRHITAHGRWRQRGKKLGRATENHTGKRNVDTMTTTQRNDTLMTGYRVITGEQAEGEATVGIAEVTKRNGMTSSSSSGLWIGVKGITTSMRDNGASRVREDPGEQLKTVVRETAEVLRETSKRLQETSKVLRETVKVLKSGHTMLTLRDRIVEMNATGMIAQQQNSIVKIMNALVGKANRSRTKGLKGEIVNKMAEGEIIIMIGENKISAKDTSSNGLIAITDQNLQVLVDAIGRNLADKMPGMTLGMKNVILEMRVKTVGMKVKMPDMIHRTVIQTRGGRVLAIGITAGRKQHLLEQVDGLLPRRMGKRAVKFLRSL